MVTVLYNDRMRSFIYRESFHPAVIMFRLTYNMAIFDPCHDTFQLLMLAAKDLMTVTDGEMQIIIGECDEPDEASLIGNA